MCAHKHGQYKAYTIQCLSQIILKTHSRDQTAGWSGHELAEVKGGGSVIGRTLRILLMEHRKNAY